MNPEILTSLTAAKGIPFDGKGATSRELSDQAKWFKPGKGRNPTGKVRWNLPRGDRSMKAVEWSMAEAAMACKGLEERYFFALRYQFALDDSVYTPLNYHLYKFAAMQMRRSKWPTRVMTLDGQRCYYMSLLVDMQLMEVRQPWRFICVDSKAPGMCRILMNVNKNTWARHLEPIYQVIGAEYQRWIAVGIGHMRRWLS
jgi:hypothetical protein